MSLLSFIKIREFDGEPGVDDGEYFEIFQGASGGSTTTNDGATVIDTPLTKTPISEDPELADGVWAGQNAKLGHEMSYCAQLQKQFETKETKVQGVKDKVLDLVTDGITEVISKFFAGLVFWHTGSIELAWLTDFLVEIGIGWGLESLLSLLKRGNELLAGIKAENELLLEIEKSRENYEYREIALSRHREDIKIILEQIRIAEKAVENHTQMEMKQILERLTDLAMRDDTIELGDMKLHSRGKVVEF